MPLEPDLAQPAARVEAELAAVDDAELRAAVERALALASFEAHAEQDEPFHHASFGGGAPAWPQGPLLPVLDGSPLMAALEELQQALVFNADCCEFTDSNLNAAQYLYAAGYIDRAAERLVALTR